MEFLVLAPTPTWPANLGGRKGIVSLHKRLQKYGRVHFVLYAAEGEWRDGFDELAYEGMRSQWDSFHVIAPTRPVHTWSQNEDHDADEWWDDSIGDYLKWRFNRSQFDAFFVHYTWLSKALTFAPDAVHKILYTADRFGQRREMFERRGFSKEFFHLSQEEEAKACSRAETVIAVKEQEEEYFKTICASTVLTVPHFEPRFSTKSAKPSAVLRVGVIGGYNTINRENLIEFLNVAAPIFSRNFAPIEILVAGGVCDALVDFNNPYVRQIGYVDDVADFYSMVDAVLVPMIWSSGIKIKYAEGLASSKPVLATEHAAEGYSSPHPFMRCKTFDILAQACVSVAYDRSMLPVLAAAASNAWMNSGRRLDESVARLVYQIKSRVPRFTIIASQHLGPTESLEFRRLWEVLQFTKGLSVCDVLLSHDTGIDSVAMRKLQSVSSVRKFSGRTEIRESALLILMGCSADLTASLDDYHGDLIVFDDYDPAGFEVELFADKNPNASIFIFSKRRYYSSRLAQRGNIRFFDISRYYRDAGLVPKYWGINPTYEPVVHLLCDDASVLLASALSEIARKWKTDACVEIFNLENVRCAETVERFTKPLSAKSRPRLVIDLSPSKPSVGVREIYQRAGIPLISYFSMPHVHVPLESANFSLTMYRRSELLFALNAALKSQKRFSKFDDLARARVEYMFANDAGWTIYWRVLRDITRTFRYGLGALAIISEISNTETKAVLGGST